MQRFLTRLTPPALHPVTRDQVKADLRIDEDVTEHDAKIDDLIAAATEELDARRGPLGRALISQTWRLMLPRSPFKPEVALSFPPVSEIVEIAYIDPAGAQQSFAAEHYRLISDDDRAIIELNAGASWPATADRLDAFWVDYVCGYGPTAEDVPSDIRKGIRSLCVYWWGPGSTPAVVGATASAVPFNLEGRLGRYRVPGAHF